MKPDYIKFIEKKSEYFLSESLIDSTFDINKLEDKKFDLVYVKSDFINSKFDWNEKIYKTTHGFYLYLYKNSLYDNKPRLTIYYEPNKMNELMFFLKQIIQTIKK
jgi:hypothetical protein